MRKWLNKSCSYIASTYYLPSFYVINVKSKWKITPNLCVFSENLIFNFIWFFFSDDDKQVEVQVLEVDEEVIKQILEEAEDCDDGLMNVNVKERRQCLMQMINTQVIKKVGQKATLSRMAAKNAAVVKMAVKNLNNFQRISESSSNDQEITNTGNGNEQNNLETASIIAIEASSKVKLLMAKFDNQ